MKIYLLVIFVSLLSLNANAAGQEKKINLGIGNYVLKVKYDNGNELTLNGVGISATYTLSDQLAVRAVAYSIDESDSSIDASGVDLVAYYGTGLASRGFKAYIGGGLFLENWDIAGNPADLNGIQINGGFGYNWDQVSLDYIVGIRAPGEYDDFNPTSTDRAITGSLMLSVKF